MQSFCLHPTIFSINIQFLKQSVSDIIFKINFIERLNEDKNESEAAAESKNRLWNRGYRKQHFHCYHRYVPAFFYDKCPGCRTSPGGVSTPATKTLGCDFGPDNGCHIGCYALPLGTSTPISPVCIDSVWANIFRPFHRA